MKFEKNKQSLSKRFSYAIIGVVTLIVLVFCIVAIVYSTLEANAKLKGRLETVTKIASASLPSALWNIEKDTIKDIIGALSQEDGVVYFRLIDDTGDHFKKIIAGFDKQNFSFFVESSQFITKKSDIYYQKEKIGTIQLAISKEHFKRELLLNVVSIILLGVIIITAISLISIFITKRYIFHPLQKLEDSATTIAEGNLETEIDTASKDEIGNLARSFDRMRKSIKNLFEELDESKKTLEKKVEERTSDLHKSEQKLKAVLDNIRRRVYWKDTSGVIEGGNRVLANDLGLSEPVELIGKTELDIWKRKEVVQLFKELTEEVIEKKKGRTDITETIVNDYGDQKWFKINCSPLEDERGNVTSILVTFRDITNEKQYEEKLKKARDEAEKANKAKDQFLANVSHEIRTPLNSIIGFIKLVLETNSDPQQNKDYLKRVKSSAQDLSRIINDILDYSKMESGELEIVHSEFRLENLLEEIMNNFKEQAACKGIRLILDKKKETPGALLGDDLRLKQILNNKMSNAIKATEAGSIKLEVSCLEKDESRARILFSIKDTGCGISPNDKEKIFLPHEQINNSKNNVLSGIGLGLTISKQLVELMGGEIWIESELGKGSTFHVFIPFARQSEDKVNKELQTRIMSDDFDLKCFQGLYVLVVEDDKSSQVLVNSILSKTGMKVNIVGNGNEAFNLVQSTHYDVVLMDMKIPGIDGYELTRRIRKDKRFAPLPIIAVTAHAMVGERKKCLDAGANDYISKPIDSDNLLITIKRWIQRGGKNGYKR